MSNKKSLTEIIEENKRILRAEYEKGYLAGFKEAESRNIEVFLEFLKFKAGTLEGFESLVTFDIKDYEKELEKWEARK